MAFLAALGLLIVAIGDTLARLDVFIAPLVWWLGLLVIVTPLAARLIGREAARRERLALVLLVGLALYGVKIMGAPSSFLMLDEFLHWATLDDIVVSGRLFTTNNILLASPYYPGLEIASDLLVRTGFSTWEAGTLVVGVGRVLLMLALFLLYERASGDSRLASVGVLVYAANPGFLFFDSQFAYESLALPLAIFAMWCIQRREVATGATLSRKAGPPDEARMARLARVGHPLALTGVLMVAIGAVVVTHHVTAMALSGCLVSWAIVGTVLRRRGGRPIGLVGPAAMSVIATLAWMLYVASVTVGYLVPALGGAIDQVLALIAGDEGSRDLFRSATGVAAPAWEQVVGYGSVAVMVVALAIGLPIIWRRWRTSALPLTLALISLLFPVSMVARLTVRGAELAQRSAEFIFVGSLVRGRARRARDRGHGRATGASQRLALGHGGLAAGSSAAQRGTRPALLDRAGHDRARRAVHGRRDPGHRSMGAHARPLSRGSGPPLGQPPGHRSRGMDPGRARARVGAS